MIPTMETEDTPLLHRNEEPEYVFQSSILKRRKEKIRQFQFCVLSIMLIGVVMFLVIATAYALSDQYAPSANDTNSSSIPFENAAIVALSALHILPDKPKNASTYYDEAQWAKALQAGYEALEAKDKMEAKLGDVDEDSASYKHQKLLSNSELIQRMARVGYSEQYATEYLNKLNKNVTLACGSRENAGTYREFCDANFKPKLCHALERYRSFNGSCNNLKKPALFGVAYKPFRRILPPDYADGASKPRKSQDGSELPSARNVSLTVHRPYYKDDPKFTVMLAVWGQFLDHDITATATSSKKDGSPISCCSVEALNYTECFPVLLDVYDPYYINFNISCMEFVRSAPAPTCCLGPREQLNTVSSYIDASMIYGTDLGRSLGLRSFVNGSLRVHLTDDNRTLLPVSKDLHDGCNRQEEADKGRYCFLTGDARANENLHLTSMHLLWLRQHNLVATKLAALNPRWADETLFQEARKILIAQIQHITYNEFLPSILGQHLMRVHDLHPKKTGFFGGYNDSLDASVSNAFAASAFRFAHSIIPNLIKLLGNDSSPEFVQMHHMLLDPFRLYSPNGMDKTLRGALHTPIQANDPYFASELKQHLFERIVEKRSDSRACGLDLVTLNIQRGRDHGLPGYTIWREHCGLFRPRTFEQLAGVIDDDSLNYINNIYSHPDDIDLYTGALSERPMSGSIVGPTLVCILQDQFVRLKKGDRFWYENPQVFTSSQLAEIRKSLLARIICDNSDGVGQIQEYVMKRIDRSNALGNCEKLPQLNISLWGDFSVTRLMLHNDNFKVEVMN